VPVQAATVCAFRAAQLGLKVALIDKRAALGGTMPQCRLHPEQSSAPFNRTVCFLQRPCCEHGNQVRPGQRLTCRLAEEKRLVVAKLTGGVAALAKPAITVLAGARLLLRQHRLR